MNKQKLIIIVGPTAVGKTALSVEVAKKFNGEIISADSAQVYQGLNIGSAKVTKEEAQGIKHHLLDVVPFNGVFTTGDWVKMAKDAINEICAKGKTPVIVGGTGLYVNSLLFDIGVSCGRDEEYRNKLYEIYNQENGKEIAYNMLKEVDPESAKKIHPNQKDRVIRALEIFHITGKKKSEMKNSTESNYDYILFGLTDDRDKLYERINYRTDKMLESGLIEEVQSLMNKGLTKENQSMQSIGYKEVYSYLTNEYDKETFIEKLKQNTRNYAKRQFTYFKKLPNIIWKNYKDKEEIFNLIKEFINE